MSYIETVEPAAATGRLAEIYSTIAGQHGHVSNIWIALSLEPDFVQAHLDMNIAGMHKPGGLARLEREAIAMSVASANECLYCLHHHTEMLRKAGGSEDLVEALTSGEEPDTETKRLRRIIYFVRKLTLLPNSMSRRDADDLRLAGLSDYEILQTVQVAAYCNYANRLAVALGVELETGEAA
jgi:uncharacterized peroxidase-related enzyme